MTPGGPGVESIDLTEDTHAVEDFNLEEDYEDDVFKVFFENKKQLLAYSTQLEDNNLFKIALV